MTRRAGAALLVLVIGAVAGCGGQNEAHLGPPLTAPETTSSQGPAPAAPAATTTAKPRTRTTKASAVAKKPAATPKPVVVSKKPAAKSKPGNEAPLACLAQAGLYKPAKSGDGLWSAVERKSGKPVFIDGPYKAAGEAKSSAASLAGVQDAAKGGLYVVSAAVRSHAGPVVRIVAKCLEKRG
jgi:hypothetical protein